MTSKEDASLWFLSFSCSFIEFLSLEKDRKTSDSRGKWMNPLDFFSYSCFIFVSVINWQSIWKGRESSLSRDLNRIYKVYLVMYIESDSKGEQVGRFAWFRKRDAETRNCNLLVHLAAFEAYTSSKSRSSFSARFQICFLMIIWYLYTCLGSGEERGSIAFAFLLFLWIVVSCCCFSARRTQ